MNSAIGERVEVYWPNEKKYFSGTIDQYENKSKKEIINYGDEDVEMLDFTKEKWHRLPSSTNFLALLGTLRELVAKHPNKVCEITVRDPLDPRFFESSRNQIKRLFERGSYVAVRKE